jgi:hypothetical protein
MNVQREYTLITIKIHKLHYQTGIKPYIHPTRCNVTQFISSGNCSTCFGWYHHPSSGAQTTVSTKSGICQTVTAICRYRELECYGSVRQVTNVWPWKPCDFAWREYEFFVATFARPWRSAINTNGNLLVPPAKPLLLRTKSIQNFRTRFY